MLAQQEPEQAREFSPEPEPEPESVPEPVSERVPEPVLAPGGEAGPVAPIAYITTSYPSLSHTFILREVLALRRRGVQVHPISLRATGGEHMLSEENRREAARTFAVRPVRRGLLLRAHVSALAAHPRAYLRTLREALALRPPGPRGALWQVFYFAEAILVWRDCATRGVAHIHSHHASPSADVALLAARFGDLAGSGPASWSLTMHGPTELWDVRWFRVAEKVRRASAVMCISDFTRSQLMALVEEEHWPKLSVVRCGVVPSDYEDVAPPPGTGAPKILCVGRLVPEKGQAVLLRALAELRARGERAEVVFVGSGPTREPLERLCGELGLGELVTFAGAVGQDEIRRYYEECSIFCLPSFSEGLPVVFMEAMACARPPVASAIAGVGELIEHGENGLLVRPGNAGELAGALGRLLADPGLRERMGQAARMRIRGEFDVETSAQALERIFAALTARAGSPPVLAGERKFAPASLVL